MQMPCQHKNGATQVSLIRLLALVFVIPPLTFCLVSVFFKVFPSYAGKETAPPSGKTSLIRSAVPSVRAAKQAPASIAALSHKPPETSESPKKPEVPITAPSPASTEAVAGAIDKPSPDADVTAEMPDEDMELAAEEAGAVTKITHAAIGANATASSTHAGEKGESSPLALVDGDILTRWSSEYSEPQEIVIQWKKPIVIGKILLHWENASATRYAIHLSEDGKKWTSAHQRNMGAGWEPEPRIDEINMKNATAKAVKLLMLRRINPSWGFSLYEIEVVSGE